MITHQSIQNKIKQTHTHARTCAHTCTYMSLIFVSVIISQKCCLFKIHEITSLKNLYVYSKMWHIKKTTIDLKICANKVLWD